MHCNFAAQITVFGKMYCALHLNGLFRQQINRRNQPRAAELLNTSETHISILQRSFFLFFHTAAWNQR